MTDQKGKTNEFLRSKLGPINMEKSRSTKLGFLLAFSLGVAVGGIGVAQITRAIPKMMSNILLNMVSQMGGEGCDPEEM